MSNTLWAINGHLVVKVIGFFIVIASFIDYKHPRHGFHSKLVQTIFIFVIILHKQTKKHSELHWSTCSLWKSNQRFFPESSKSITDNLSVWIPWSRTPFCVAVIAIWRSSCFSRTRLKRLRIGSARKSNNVCCHLIWHFVSTALFQGLFLSYT